MSEYKAIALYVTISAVLAGMFILWPGIDLAVAAYFFRPQEKFFLSQHPFFVFVHDSVSYLAGALLVLWGGLLLAGYWCKREVLGVPRRTLLYLILAMALGPGLVVNTVFKDNWGRARPHQIEAFGGTKQFTPAFVMTDQCERNCSFVSGDPSVGFYLVALAFAFPARRRLFTIFGLGVGIGLGATRVVMGAHFLSDVLFSGVFTVAVCYWLWRVMMKRELGVRT